MLFDEALAPAETMARTNGIHELEVRVILIADWVQLRSNWTGGTP